MLFVRSGPLNVTPAVPRYIEFLNAHGFRGLLRGLEYRFREDVAPVRHLDSVRTYRHAFSSKRERLTGLALWQLFQLRALALERPDVVQFCDVFSALPALAAKYLFRARLVFDIRDNARFAMSHYGAVPAAILGALESLASLAADAVVVVSEPLRETLPQSVRSRALVVPNAPLEDSFVDLRFGPPGRIRVNLAGFVSVRRNLEAFCRVCDDDPTVELDLYGTVADAATQDLLSRHGLGPVVSVDRAASIARMADADVVSLMYDPSIEINRYAAPNKYYEALMLGKPVLCARGMLLERELSAQGCGLSAEYGDPASLGEALRSLSSVERRRAMGRRGREHFLKNYWGSAGRAMRALYGDLNILGLQDPPSTPGQEGKAGALGRNSLPGS
jgi:glycosyltransferase involved in cell wall biosynthesis